MKSKRYTGCCITILLILFLTLPAHSGWQPDHSSEVSVKQSPFSLPDNITVNTSAADRRPSPFSLPAKSKKTVPKIEVTEETATHLLKKGTALAREGKFEEARTALAKSLEQDPENLVTLNNLGLVMRKLGRIDEAVKAYQFALEINDTYALTYKNLGVLLENNDEKQLAVEAYRQYSQLAPDAADAKNVSDRADWLEGKK